MQLKLSTRLYGGFITVVLIAAAIGLVGIRNMSELNDLTDQMYDFELLGVSYVKEANINLLYAARAEKNFLLAPSEELRKTYAEGMNKYKKSTQEYMNKAKPLFRSAKGREMLDKAERAFQDWDEVTKKVVEVGLTEALNDDSAAVRLSLGEARKKIDVLDQVMTDLTVIKEENAKEASDEGTRIYKTSFLFLSCLAGIGVLLGMGIGVMIARGTMKQLGEDPAVIAEVAETDRKSVV